MENPEPTPRRPPARAPALVGVVMAALAGAAPALAGERPPLPATALPAPLSPMIPPPAEARPEPGRRIAQFLVGAGTAVVGLAVTFADTPSDALVLVPFLLTPAAVGGAVCMVGDAGAYRGSCGAAVLGAYLGAATIVPLVWLGARLESEEDSRSDAGPLVPPTVLLGFAVGWLVAQPVAATLGWHLTRHPKNVALLAAAPPLASRLPLDGSLRRRPVAAPGEAALARPLLSARF
jgi:hypothetical protein